jgi:predicted transcriptional regulator
MGDLPPLQNRIMLYLARNEPQAINETVEGCKGHCKSLWIALNALEQKGLIKKADLKTYRNREYPRFWLTQESAHVCSEIGQN